MSKYLREECGYCLHEDEQKLLLARYDKGKDFRISRDEFHAQVAFYDGRDDFHGDRRSPELDHLLD